MQTMTFEKAQAVTRALLFICSLTAVVVALASFAGAPVGLYCLAPLSLIYLLIYLLRLQEWAADRKKPLAERVDQGQRGVRPGS